MLPFHYFMLLFSLCLESYAVWPAPQKFENGSSVMWLSQNLNVIYSGSVGINSPCISHPTKQEFFTQAAIKPNPTSQSIVEGAISRAKVALFKQNIVPWKLVPHHGLSSFEPPTDATKRYINMLELVQTKGDSTFKPLAGQVDESYKLTIGTDGTAKITAVSSFGILHGLETFVQLFFQHSSESDIYTNLAPIVIFDSPKFPHRGLNLDVSRNWYVLVSLVQLVWSGSVLQLAFLNHVPIRLPVELMCLLSGTQSTIY